MLIIGQKENVDNVSILYTALLVKIHYYDFFMLAQADHMKLIIFPSPTHFTFSIFENTIVQAKKLANLVVWLWACVAWPLLGGCRNTLISELAERFYALVFMEASICPDLIFSK